MAIVGIIIAVVFFTVGIIGTILPLLPGAPLIWLGMLIYGLFVKFDNLSWSFFVAQGLVVALVFLIDYLAGVVGTKHYGGSKAAIWGSVLGGLIGTILLGPFGLIIGPFIGAAAGEFYRKNDLEQAIHVGIGTLIGFLGGTVLKLAVEVLMIVWFFITVF
ncbi:MAG: DUF456 domain-containing protein [Desulfotomaculaceae bacterium]|nr:DUF456 domain-containing protein [Desulfotomaculaceae bacterium]